MRKKREAALAAAFVSVVSWLCLKAMVYISERIDANR